MYNDMYYYFFSEQLLTTPLASLLNNCQKSLGASESHGPHQPP